MWIYLVWKKRSVTLQHANSFHGFGWLLCAPNNNTKRAGGELLAAAAERERNGDDDEGSTRAIKRVCGHVEWTTGALSVKANTWHSPPPPSPHTLFPSLHSHRCHHLRRRIFASWPSRSVKLKFIRSLDVVEFRVKIHV